MLGQKVMGDMTGSLFYHIETWVSPLWLSQSLYLEPKVTILYLDGMVEVAIVEIDREKRRQEGRSGNNKYWPSILFYSKWDYNLLNEHLAVLKQALLRPSLCAFVCVCVCASRWICWFNLETCSYKSTEGWTYTCIRSWQTVNVYV